MPHVTGVLTDLDGSGARRAIESLRAEVRWREAELARVGARDILDPRVDVPRLVIVVDEFAALLGEHPELHAVFTDVAARGRALGMHLVLGTQRPSGVVRESLLANCPLRISLRVTDPADSRAVIGTDEAATLCPVVRTPAVSRSCARRRSSAATSAHRAVVGIGLRAIARRRRRRRPAAPTVAAGPARADRSGGSRGAGRAARRHPADRTRRRAGASAAAARSACACEERGLLVVGSGGSGKSTALSLLAAQAEAGGRAHRRGRRAGVGCRRRPRRALPAPGTLVLIDDLDALAAALPPDYARELLERLELSIRGAGEAGILVVAAAQRLTGGVARIAELLPRRLVLAASSRAEHIAAGGDPAHYVPGSPPGRGRLDGRSRAGRDDLADAARIARPRPCRGIRAGRSPAS